MKTSILASLAALCLAPIAAHAHGGQQGPCSEASRPRVAAFVANYIDVFNSHDTSRFLEVMRPDALNENPFGLMDVEQLQGAMLGFYAAFPDLHYTLEDFWVDGDRLIIEYTYAGTHLGDLMGIPPTGTVVHGRGLEVHEIVGGKIAATRNYSDVFGLFAQLGVL